jgi:hypothetical protein
LHQTTIFYVTRVRIAAINWLVHHSTIFETSVEPYRRRTASDKQSTRRRQLSSDDHPG